MAAMFRPTIVKCDCPCHDPEHPLQCNHLVPCCCPHQYVCHIDCPDCLDAAAANLPTPLGERVVPTFHDALEAPRRSA